MPKLAESSTNLMWINSNDANLDDTSLFTLKKLFSRTSCGKAFPNALDGSGFVRITRKPIGKPPVALAFGVLWLYLLKLRDSKHPSQVLSLGPKMEIALADPSDLTIEVIKGTSVSAHRRSSNQSPQSEPQSALFLAKESTLADTSPVLCAMLSTRWRQSGTVTLKEDSIVSMTILMGIFHEKVPDNSSISIKDVWLTVKACDYYDFDLKGGKPARWLEIRLDNVNDNQRNTMENLGFVRQTLFPCFFFDQAKWFLAMTKELVYSSLAQIYESKPILSGKMNLPPVMFQQRNAARGQLRTMLERGLYKAVTSAFSRDPDHCKSHVVFRYLKDPDRIQVRPFGNTIYQHSISDILARLKKFDGTNLTKRHSPPRDCVWCGYAWEKEVNKTQIEVEAYFDGLCLDCLKTKTNDNSDRWHRQHREDSSGSNWDKDCHVKHGEPSRYFSLNGF